MEANEFLNKIKADGSGNSSVVFTEQLKEFKTIIKTLNKSEQQSFALNVMCILCRNLKKSPGWINEVDFPSVLQLFSACLELTKKLEPKDQMNKLACIYHVHKTLTKQDIAPETVMKISSAAFEDPMNPEYMKTYWAIVVDTMIYIETLKPKCDTKTFLPHLNNLLLKVLLIYNTVSFVSDNLVVTVKKLYFLFSSHPNKLLTVYKNVFSALYNKKTVKSLNVPEEKKVILYKKLIECFSVIVDVASAFNFKDNPLKVAVRFAVALLGDSSGIFHCLQSFYLNGICNILQDTEENDSYTATLFRELALSIESIERLGHKDIASESYAYIAQILKIYIETLYKYQKEKWLTTFTVDLQEEIFTLTNALVERLEQCSQVVKCESCKINSGLHDALRLSFVVQNLASKSLSYGLDVTSILKIIKRFIITEYHILGKLKEKRCANYEKYLSKLQIDVHNTAIALSSKNYKQDSLDYFDMYINTTLRHCIVNLSDSDKQALRRAFNNKAICQYDVNDYENALRTAFIAVVLSVADKEKFAKHIALVIDIKSKALNATEGRGEVSDDLQKMTSLDACRLCVENGQYPELKPLFKATTFSDVLRAEMAQYASVWPSLLPAAGVWRGLHDLLRGRDKLWTAGEPEESLVWTASAVVMATAVSVRTLQHDDMVAAVGALCARLAALKPKSPQLKMAHATLLLIKAEHDLSEANTKHGWKSKTIEQYTRGLDCVSPSQTVGEEGAALGGAAAALALWTELLPSLASAGVRWPEQARQALQCALALAPQLLHAARAAPALQLAAACAHLARALGDRSAYIASVGMLLDEAQFRIGTLDEYVEEIAGFVGAMLDDGNTRDAALTYLAQAAIYHNRCGDKTTAAKILRYLQDAVLEECSRDETCSALWTSYPKLLETQLELCAGAAGAPSTLGALAAIHRHYAAARLPAHLGVGWAARRYHGATIARAGCVWGARGLYACARLQLWRRARALAPAALRLAPPAHHARLQAALLFPHNSDNAQVKVDTVKSILELPPTQVNTTKPLKKIKAPEKKSTKKIIDDVSPDVETVLDASVFKVNANDVESASPHAYVSGFKMADFLTHPKTCECQLCQNPWTSLVFLEISSKEASIHFRNERDAIAENYFKGTLKVMKYCQSRLRYYVDRIRSLNYQSFVVDIVEDMLKREYAEIATEALMEMSFFELSRNMVEIAEAHIAEILKLSDSIKDCHLKVEVMNLMAAKDRVVSEKTQVTKVTDLGIERDFDRLRLTPNKEVVLRSPKTPELETVPKAPEVPKDPRKNARSNAGFSAEDLPKHNRKRLPVPNFTVEPKTPSRSLRRLKLNDK